MVIKTMAEGSRVSVPESGVTDVRSLTVAATTDGRYFGLCINGQWFNCPINWAKSLAKQIEELTEVTR